AHVAGQVLGHRARMLHAVSPAVTPEATARVQRHAAGAGWLLTLIDGGEFRDPDYLRNPVDRCYFCKSNLFRRIRAETDAIIATGANTDDLDDFRPGLRAAEEEGVVHPYVEAGGAKADVRAIARRLRLTDVAELPAQPCLASRVETGIAIKASDLDLVRRIEGALADDLGVGDIRCRVVADGIRVELSPALLERAAASPFDKIERMCRAAGKAFLGTAPYRRGSAFLKQRSGP
ncbi:MAG: hypothetical protein QGI13_17210, partial [Rhodospirillales bacterium]|nr:hypothetical protein [Rhodospirillales bacterium]